LFALRLLALQLLLHPALEEEARVGVALIAAVSTQLSTCFAVKEMSGHNIAITDLLSQQHTAAGSGLTFTGLLAFAAKLQVPTSSSWNRT